LYKAQVVCHDTLLRLRGGIIERPENAPNGIEKSM
jgi:hypothetical protein